MAGRGRGQQPIIVNVPPIAVPAAPGAANPYNEILKTIVVTEQGDATLPVWLESTTETLKVRNLTRIINLDLDVNAQVVPGFDWNALNQVDREGDMLVRYILLKNVNPDISMVLEHLEHASEIYRALKEVECLIVQECVCGMRDACSNVPQWGWVLTLLCCQ